MKSSNYSLWLKLLALFLILLCFIEFVESISEELDQRELSKKKNKKKNKKKKKKKKKRKRKKGKKKRSRAKKIKGIPYPYTGKETAIDEGLHYEEPEIHVSNAPSLQMSYSKRGEKLRNPVFDPAIHKNENINYFKLKFPTYDPNEPRDVQVQDYVNYWMNINPKKESAKIDFIVMNKEECLNRVQVSYFNQLLKLSKTYYLDIRFMPEHTGVDQYIEHSHKIYIGKKPVPYYGQNLNITENYDCKAIKKKLKNPEFFTCNPLVVGPFHVENTYKVDATLSGQLFKNLNFTVKIFVQLPSEELSPDIVTTPDISNPTLLKYVLEAVRAIKRDQSTMGKFKNLIYKTLSTEDFVQRISAFDDVLDEFSKLYKNSQKNSDDSYQSLLKNLLMDKKKKEFNFEKEEFVNYNLLLMYSEQITSFQLKKAEKKVVHQILNNGSLKTYLIRSKRAIINKQIFDVYDYLDYLKYYKDKRLEKKILNGFAESE